MVGERIQTQARKSRGRHLFTEVWEEQRLGGRAKAHMGWVEVDLRDERDCSEHTGSCCLFFPCVRSDRSWSGV